ncbi:MULTISPECIES: hypothetical protein [Oceanobacillus]|uniref:Uncharacterized protein n=1 Tax=Oceanobacillus kimchii TaxID=746691 RepID=A0ABQ5TDT9_9BACI|nr:MULTISPECIES: hypothetical protein [Oceanobacillus]MBT2653189.1 hypothetical protein [Oceanobacillus sp. ISL-73]MCT1577791.1 hypothetical protein [Oceanobacillus kimchii]MCT2136779.1 hypothetical protein [Oceanobacillus kimchii]OEH53905.1 hypothetical protein AQ616_15640 [Oceanobacillus sp. E9]GLO64475.1 hypothetical protein MACH08_02590 [Oceanobacillus kimchii]
MLLTGNIISGQFDEVMNEFSIQRVKHFTTESTIKESQLKSLYDYLKKHEGDMGGQIITLYDQLPIRLNQEEISLFISDLEEVQLMYRQ